MGFLRSRKEETGNSITPFTNLIRMETKTPSNGLQSDNSTLEWIQKTPLTTFDRIYYGFLWPTFSYWSQWFQYLELRVLGEKPKSKNLELSSGPIPYYLIYQKQRRGELFVISDCEPSTVHTSRFLANVLCSLSLKRNERQYIILDNKYLPFKDGAFDSVKDVHAMNRSEFEIRRVLKLGGAYEHLFFFKFRRHINNETWQSIHE